MAENEKEAPPGRQILSVALGNGPRGPELIAVDETGRAWRLLLGEDSRFLRWDALPDLPAEVPEA